MNLVWLCPSVRKPVGGVKVIYRQASIAHQLLMQRGQGSSAVLHPNSFGFQASWFDQSVPMRRAYFGLRWLGKPSWSNVRGVFDASQDVVVIPELWVRKYGSQLLELGVPYSIYVQNGYFINKGEFSDLVRAYSGARCVMVVSENAAECVKLAFPSATPNILRLHCSVDSNLFFYPTQVNKEKLITYMPRKLADHVQKVLFFLKPHLPSHWKLQAIDGMNEAQVAQTLMRSSIFMSFSHFEGLGLPPLEAALCGNHVVGYTGQGGKEFWWPESFDNIESGDVLGFAQQVLARVDQIDRGVAIVDRSNTMRLAQIYGAQQEQTDLEQFLGVMGF